MIGEALLPEFEQEMQTVRKTLERIPEDKLTWKPHEKSMPLGRLASHLAELPGWALDDHRNGFVRHRTRGPTAASACESWFAGGDTGFLRQKYFRRQASSCEGIGRASSKELVAYGGHANHDLHASDRHAAHVDHESHNSSPGSVGSVSQVKRHSRAAGLWTLGG